MKNNSDQSEKPADAKNTPAETPPDAPQNYFVTATSRDPKTGQLVTGEETKTVKESK